MNWIWVVGMLFAGSIGFFIGTTLVTVGVRRDVADLEADRLELERERAAAKLENGKAWARADSTATFIPIESEAGRILRAALIQAGMAKANDKGFWQ